MNKSLHRKRNKNLGLFELIAIALALGAWGFAKRRSQARESS